MSRLSDREFKAMNDPWRHTAQRLVEFPMLKHLGVPITGRDVLEVGCGSGYGAQLLASLMPRSYTGIDLMPEQIALAQQRLPQARFILQDASDLVDIPSASVDTVVVFGVLHHIPEWREAVCEITRVLRPAGEVYLEEPDGGVIDWFDRVFKWGHPATFRLRDLEAQLEQSGFKIVRKSYYFGFGVYRLQKR
jgi:ubiquinone/menaquinone biosynthesis C-methylase UbiE